MDDGSKDAEQLEDGASNLEDGSRDPDGISKIPEGKPVSNCDGSYNSDDDKSTSYYSGSDQDDTTLSALNKNQLQGNTIPPADGLFLKRVEIVSIVLTDSKKEVIAA